MWYNILGLETLCFYQKQKVKIMEHQGTLNSTYFPVCAVVCEQSGKWTGQMCASPYRFHYKMWC